MLALRNVKILIGVISSKETKIKSTKKNERNKKNKMKMKTEMLIIIRNCQAS